jgi:ankyrin repeat protein
VDNWGAHTRGEAEEDKEVIRGVCNLLASTGARSSMHQLILSHHGFTKTVFVSSTPIRVLAEEGLATIYQYLLKMDPKAFQQSDSNEIHNHLTHTPLLAAKDADTDPLLIAIGNGHCRIAAALLAFGSDVNVRSRAGETPMHIAAKRGHDEATKLLLTHGADIDAQDKRFRTPLHLACKYGHTETVVHLLEAGANLNAECEEGWTPLHFAVAHGRLDVNVLLERGANVFAKDHRGFTPLETAVKVADVSNFEKLIQTTIKQSANTQVSLLGTDISFDGIRNLPFRSRQRELHRQLGVYFPDSDVKLHL